MKSLDPLFVFCVSTPRRRPEQIFSCLFLRRRPVNFVCLFDTYTLNSFINPCSPFLSLQRAICRRSLCQRRSVFVPPEIHFIMFCLDLLQSISLFFHLSSPRAVYDAPGSSLTPCTLAVHLILLILLQKALHYVNADLFSSVRVIKNPRL